MSIAMATDTRKGAAHRIARFTVWPLIVITGRAGASFAAAAAPSQHRGFEHSAAAAGPVPLHSAKPLQLSEPQAQARGALHGGVFGALTCGGEAEAAACEDRAGGCGGVRPVGVACRGGRAPAGASALPSTRCWTNHPSPPAPLPPPPPSHSIHPIQF